ncbi:hypothetical protein EDB19DRAFT_1943526 [Suillus lakei]|nr:hypothetical protein EDB19DRAFT_1943526 [Suillus lakei]
MQLEQLKKDRKKIHKEDDYGFEENGDDLIQSLGWLSSMCPVAVHWHCLMKTLKDEITCAVCVCDKVEWKSQQPDGYNGHEPPDSKLPNRKELGIMQTTEFICANCMKGGICMGFKQIALEIPLTLMTQLLLTISNLHPSINSRLDGVVRTASRMSTPQTRFLPGIHILPTLLICNIHSQIPQSQGASGFQPRQGIIFASHKSIWAADKDTMEKIQEVVPDMEQGNSWARALEQIATEKGAKQVTEVTGRGARRKPAAIFSQQKLDHIEGLEDMLDMSRKKKKH